MEETDEDRRRRRYWWKRKRAELIRLSSESAAVEFLFFSCSISCALAFGNDRGCSRTTTTTQTPLYVYDEETLLSTLKLLTSLMNEHVVNRLFFAMKANPNKVCVCGGGDRLWYCGIGLRLAIFLTGSVAASLCEQQYRLRVRLSRRFVLLLLLESSV